MTTSALAPFGQILTVPNDTPFEQLQFHDLEKKLIQQKLLVIRGIAHPTRDELLSFSQKAQTYRTLNWSFGPVMEMKESQDPQNYLFSREQVPFHWDGAFHQVPDYLIFSCVHAPTKNSGGETLFTNTQKIYEEATAEERAIWSKIELVYATEKLAHYGGRIQGPLVQKHPRLSHPVLRFAEPVLTKLNPVTLDVLGISQEKSQRVVKDLTEKIYDPRYCYRHEWHNGDLLIADNHTLIHGRTAFKQNVPRHLRRIQLIKEPDRGFIY